MPDTQQNKKISVQTFFSDNEKSLDLKIISGERGLQRDITEDETHRPGLALAGFIKKFTFRRIQLIGNTEIMYLDELTKADRINAIERVLQFEIPCFIITDKNEPPVEWIEATNTHGVPIFCTPKSTSTCIQIIEEYLNAKFAPRTYIHGSLVDVYGIGVLITGRSGIGKSEVALDLVSRGHRLVVDDIVTITQRTCGILIGLGNERLKYHMEIRGLGVIDIRAMFGIRGIRKQKRVEVQLDLVDWDNSHNYERLGIEEITTNLLGVEIPKVTLPIYPGKSIAVIAETIAMNQLLKIYGLHSAKKFEKELIRRKTRQSGSLKEYLGSDFE